MTTPELLAHIDAVLGDESKPAGAGSGRKPSSTLITRAPAPFCDPTIWKEDDSE